MKSFKKFVREGDARRTNRVYARMLDPNTAESDPSDDEPDTSDDIKRREILNKAVGAGTGRTPDNNEPIS